MINSRPFGFRVSARIALLAATTAIVACSNSDNKASGGGNVGGGGGGGGGGTFVATEDAQIAVADTVVGAIKSNEDAATTLALTSQAVDAVAVGAGLTLNGGAGGGGGGNVDIGSQIGAALGTVFSSTAGVRVGDTVTYDPVEEDLCADPLFAGLAGRADCVQFYSHLTAELNIASADDGTLAFMFDGFTVLTIGYAPDTAYVELDMAETRNVFEAIVQQQGTSNLPDTMQGRPRLTLESLGPDSGRITFSIEEAINFDDADLSFQLAATPTAFALTMDGPNNTASIDLGLAGFSSMLPLLDNIGTSRQATVGLGGLSFLTALADDGNNLMGTEIGLGDDGFFIDVVDAANPGDDPVDFSVMLPNFDFVVDGANATLTFNSVVDFAFAVDDRFGLFDPTYTAGQGHTFDLDIAQGTQLVPVGADAVSGETVFRVDMGSVSAAGTGDFVGVADAVVAQCFTLDLTVLFVAPTFPMVVIACP